MTEELPSGPKLAALSSKLLAIFPSECWHEKARHALNHLDQQRIAVACSGGADSTFALLLVYAAFPHLRQKMHILHFNHRLRTDSEGDETFVKELAQGLKLDHSIFRSSGLESKKDEGTLREERLKAFIEFCEKGRIALVIQGHNQDDVAETILWRFSRGSSPQGLCSPRPVHKHGNVLLVRPFITIKREDIRSILARLKIPWRDDQSNQSTLHLRNRIRMNGLRMLKQDVDRDLLSGMSRSRDLLEEQEDAIDEWARRVQHDCIKSGKVNAHELRNTPVAVRRRVIYRWFSIQSYNTKLSSSQMKEILEFIELNGKLDLPISPHQKIRGLNGFIFLECEKPNTPDWSVCSIHPNGKLFLPCGNFIRFNLLKLESTLLKRILSGHVDPSKEAFLRQKGNVSQKLFARKRHPGDSYRPIGAPGNKKVKNWMIDRKIDPALRNSIPLILNCVGEIIWIPGLPPAESHRIDGGEKMVIHLTYARTAT